VASQSGFLLAAHLARLPVVAAAFSLDDQLSWPTLKHFVACVFASIWGFSPCACSEPGSFLDWFVLRILAVLVVGWEQHFGGLEATRQYFFREIYPQLKEVSPEYLKKISANRIFSTLFYPNSLAGALLLLLSCHAHAGGQCASFTYNSGPLPLAGLIAIAPSLPFFGPAPKAVGFFDVIARSDGSFATAF